MPNDINIFLLVLLLVPTASSEEQNVMKLMNEVKELRVLFQEIQDSVSQFLVLQEKLNDTSELETRVQQLEEDVVTLQGDVEDRELYLEMTENQLLDDIRGLQSVDGDIQSRLEVLEAAIIEPRQACLSSPCVNGSTCVDVNVETFVCLCRDGYFGLTCSNGYIDTTFLAALSSDVSASGTVIFDRDDINPGGHYNTTTGEYTVPYEGIYQFSVQLQSSSGSGQVFIFVYLNGNNLIFNDNWFSDLYRSTTFLRELSTGQVVTVYTSTNLNGDPDELMSYFAGHLIFPY